MDIFFADPSEVPLPPDEVRIRELNVEVSPEGRRLRVYLEVDPFQRRPNAELALFDREGREVSSVSIIESMTRKMELVMHVRGAAPGACTLQATLYYASLPESAAGPDDAAGSLDIERHIVDSRRVAFEVPA